MEYCLTRIRERLRPRSAQCKVLLLYPFSQGETFLEKYTAHSNSAYAKMHMKRDHTTKGACAPGRFTYKNRIKYCFVKRPSTLLAYRIAAMLDHGCRKLTGHSRERVHDRLVLLSYMAQTHRQQTKDAERLTTAPSSSLPGRTLTFTALSPTNPTLQRGHQPFSTQRWSLPVNSPEG